MKKYLIIAFLLLFSGPAIAQHFQAQGPRDDEGRPMTETIPWEHGLIHDGELFGCSVDSALGNGDSLNVLVVTPNSAEETHIFVSVSVSGASTFYIFEDDASASGGVACTAFNYDRNSSKTSNTLLYKQGAINTGSATLLWKEFVGAGKKTFSQTDRHHEYILKINTKYAYLIISAAVGNTVTFGLHWYEED